VLCLVDQHPIRCKHREVAIRIVGLCRHPRCSVAPFLRHLRTPVFATQGRTRSDPEGLTAVSELAAQPCPVPGACVLPQWRITFLQGKAMYTHERGATSTNCTRNTKTAGCALWSLQLSFQSLTALKGSELNGRGAAESSISLSERVI